MEVIGGRRRPQKLAQKRGHIAVKFDQKCEVFELRVGQSTANNVTAMEPNSHVINQELLQKLSGKRTPASIRRWANAHGIRIIEGAAGPWTTLEAVNAALGVSASDTRTYSPDIL